jgi:hypothetical protein
MSTQRIGKYACLEIERRYLLRQFPTDLAGRPPAWRITDHYVLPTRLRLRRMESGETVHWKLGQKFRAPGQHPFEATITNLTLTEQEYEARVHRGAQVISRSSILPRRASGGRAVSRCGCDDGTRRTVPGE